MGSKTPNSVERREFKLKIYQRDGGKCMYCNIDTTIVGPRPIGAKVPLDAASIDHIIPYSQTQVWCDEANVVLACHECNSIRGDMDAAQFLTMRHVEKNQPWRWALWRYVYRRRYNNYKPYQSRKRYKKITAEADLSTVYMALPAMVLEFLQPGPESSFIMAVVFIIVGMIHLKAGFNLRRSAA